MLLEEIIDSRVYKELQDVPTIGIDIGSRMGKGVLLANGSCYTALTATGVSMQKTSEILMDKLQKQAGITKKDIAYAVSTGYGRINLTLGDIPTKSVTEISCHGMGAHYLNQPTKTIVDIGGQDSKAIKIDPETGKVVDFIMNDKCAAGTGRFFEKVADLLSLTLEEASSLALESRKKIDISSQCVVFAESEIVTLRAKGEERADIISAVNMASARRIRNLVNRVELKPDLIFAGGVANNPGMKEALAKVIGYPFTETKMNMSYNGALGAAIIAQQFYCNRAAQGGIDA